MPVVSELFEFAGTMAKKDTVWFGMKVTPEQKRMIKALAEGEGTSAKEAVMRVVEEALVREPRPEYADSFVDGIEHILGSVEGPGDLSTNPKYLEGYGEEKVPSPVSQAPGPAL